MVFSKHAVRKSIYSRPVSRRTANSFLSSPPNIVRGGHDISGHTYILVLSIVYLLEDLTPFLPHLVPLALHPYLLKVIPTRNWSSRDPFRASDFISAQKATINVVVASSILALVGLWVLSLLNTALFFHTPQEKASGLIAGLLASFLLPKGG